MTPELYRRASELFYNIRDLPESECSAAIDYACGDDAELRTHVLWLLNADRSAAKESFLDGGAMKDTARLLGTDLPAPGAVIGNFRLVGQIGSGGMGVIFKAEDLRLNRMVALKVLPQDSISSKDSIQRFQREARAASLLNHPNIVSVFEANFEHGWAYIAMELVAGRTLRELIAGPRPIATNTILDLISQSASALSAAHEAGIVHRDIKPENIMVRDDGLVKVLDFGLAKLRESAAVSASAPQLNTRPGNVAGTVQYLSPEQVLGEKAGPKSDLFSLGVVAYELATGVRPFDRSTDGGVFNAILNHNPAPPSSIRTSIVPELDALILRLIEKDPELRFQTAVDLRSSCKRAAHQTSSSQSLPRPRIAGVRRKSLWSGAVLSLAVLASAALLMLRPRPLAPGDHMQITRLTDSGRASHPAISPDGKYVAYLSSESGSNGIRLMQVATRATIQTVPTGRGVISNLAFSPDGTYLYFIRANADAEGNGLFRAPLLGGELKRISPLPLRSFAISHDGRFAVFLDKIEDQATESLNILDLSTGESRLLNRRSGSDYFASAVAWSPDDRYIATGVCSGNPCGLAVIDSRSGSLRIFGPQSYTAVGGVAWLPDGNHWLALIAGGNTVFQVMLVDYPSGRTRRLTNDLDSYAGLSLSTASDVLTTALRRISVHISVAPWRGNAIGEATQIKPDAKVFRRRAAA